MRDYIHQQRRCSLSVDPVRVRIIRLTEEFSDIPLPEYMTPGAAGMDVRAAIPHSITLNPGEITAIPTGFAIELPHHLEAQIRPRSGLALKHGILLPNAPGTIDSDYRGEVKIIFGNFGKEPFNVQRGDRIAQMVIAPLVHIEWDEASSLNDSHRGEGGFGHSGVK